MKLELKRPLSIESLEVAYTSPLALRFSGALMTKTAQDELERVLGDVHSHILAAKIASFSLPVVLKVKEAINRAYETTLAEGLKFERREFHATFALADQKEGMRAFVEKRKPAFKHR